MCAALLFDSMLLIWSTLIIVQLTTSVNTYRQKSIRHHQSHRRPIRIRNYSTDSI